MDPKLNYLEHSIPLGCLFDFGVQSFPQQFELCCVCPVVVPSMIDAFVLLLLLLSCRLHIIRMLRLSYVDRKSVV